MRSLLLGLTLCVGSISFTACSTAQRVGDAKLRIHRHYGFMSVPGYVLDLPAVNIGTRGEREIKVRNLPVPIYPEALYLKAPETHSRVLVSGPWQATQLQLDIRTIDSRIIFSRSISLRRDMVWPWYVDLYENQYISNSLPPLRDYDLVLRVITPSSRVTDKVGLGAFKRHQFD